MRLLTLGTMRTTNCKLRWMVACVAVAMVGLSGGVRPTYAQSCEPVAATEGASCLDDVTTCNVGCTAGDVAVSKYNVISVCSGGSDDGNTCVVGNSAVCDSGGGTCELSCTINQFVTLTLQAELIANTARFDIGLYLALDGGDAKNGECSRNFLDATGLEPGTTGTCDPVCSSAGTECFKDDDCPGGETCDLGTTRLAGLARISTASAPPTRMTFAATWKRELRRS